MQNGTTRIGGDLGGTKIEAVALDGAGNELIRRRRATPAADYDGTVRAVVDLVREVEAATPAAGRPLVGANAIAGEWGHNPLPWPGDAERLGPPCYCGRRGCIETFLSGPAFAADHRAAGGSGGPPPTRPRGGG